MVKRKVTRKPAAKKKRAKKWKEVPTTALVPDDGEGTDAEPVQEVEEPELTPEDEDVEDVLQQLPQDARVELWVWDTKLDDWGYVARYPAHGFSIDMVAQECGPGKYRMVIRGPVEGRMRIRGRKIFVIGGSAAAAGPAGRPDIASGALTDLVKLQTEIMRANISRPQESMTDVVRMLAEVMRPPAPVAPVDPFKQAIEIVQLLKDGGGDKGTAFKDIRELLEMGMEMGGGGGNDDGLNVFGKSLAKLLDSLEKKETPKTTPAATPVAQLPAQTDAMRELKEFFETANVVLSKAAARNADLDFYAEWVADNVPDTLDPYFNEWFGDPGYPDVMITVFSGVAVDWLRPLLLKVRALLTEPEEAASADVSDSTPEPEPEPGAVPSAGAGDGGAPAEGGPGNIQDVAGNVELRE